MALFAKTHAFTPDSHQAHLGAKLAEMNDFANTNLAEVATRQKKNYTILDSLRQVIVCGYLFLQQTS